MTRAFLEGQLARLGGLAFAPDTLDTHWEALQDLPEALLEAAVAEVQRESEAFPSPVAIRTIADRLRPRVLALPPPTAREWTNYCDDCQDTGWRSWKCGEYPRAPWLEAKHCGRHFEHMPHDWSAPCACAEHNPAIQRKRERAAQLAASRPRAKRGE